MNGIRDRKPAAKSVVLSLLTFALLLGGFMLPACSAQEGSGAAESSDSGSAEPLAKVNGQVITEAQVQEHAAEQLEQAEAQLEQCQAQYDRTKYDIMDSNLTQMINDRLIEAEAEKRGMNKDELLAAEVEGKIKPVTDADVDAFYQENQARIRGPKEQVAPQIRQYLESQTQQTAYSDFIKSLEKDAEIALYLDPPRVEVAAEGPSIGPADAPITIVEFSDFECPFCARVVPTLDQVKENYGDKVRLVFRQFPLAMHPNAPKAAEASLCAHDQGKFWEMHDAMFENQRQLTVDGLKSQAETLGLDAAKFAECLDSDKYAEQVQADMAAGQKVGVTGTPAMFINGRLVSGAQPYDQIAAIIDDELKRTKSKK